MSTAIFSADNVLLSEYAENSQLLKRIWEWDFTRVEKRLLRERPNLNIQKALEQFRYFMYLCLATGPIFVPNQEIDDVAHTAIVFTEDWFRFSLEFNDGYIHHQPLDEPLQPNEAAQKLNQIEELSMSHFGRMVFETGEFVCGMITAAPVCGMVTTTPVCGMVTSAKTI
ncbi:hypothetical protein [Leptothoe sp. PORK10 BA2]|uniref:hypothetical protein n=1 Tax=Leptothoe sp. PORK10 BA2 TaxID=3110254 RepID=UPI002B209C0A|nr:hypothetical protein [Leptothoe sp. PORK10 BA2]MEA5464923.1 hypothetical protein [Leptothoe sp. PORK10 BA2]